MYRKLISITFGFLLCGCSVMPDWLGEKPAKPLEGKRIEILPTKTLKADSDVSDIIMDIPAIGPSQGWMQTPWIGETQMGNLPINPIQANVVKAKAGDGNEWVTNLVPQPVADDEMIFVIDGAGVISAHKASDITSIAWKLKTSDRKAKDYPQAGGLAVTGDFLVAATGDGDVIVLQKKDGKEIWRRNINLPIRTAPRLFNNKIFIETLDNQLLAIDLAAGRILWKHRGLTESTGILGAAQPAPYEDLILAPYSSGEIYGLKQESGKETWSEVVANTNRESNFDKLSDVDADPVISSGIAFVSGNSGIVNALDMFNGRKLWERAVPVLETPWISGKFLYLTTTSGELVCLQKDSGRIKWVSKLPEFAKKDKDKIYWSSPTMVDGRLLVVGNRGQMLLVIPESGEVQRTVSIPEGIYTSPIVAYNRIFLVTKKAELVTVE